MKNVVEEIITSKTVSMEELADLKSRAYCIGRVCVGDYVDVIKWFWSYNKIATRLTQEGKQCEIVVMFLFGVISRSARVFVVTDAESDSDGIDFAINGYGVQLKYGWRREEVRHWEGELVCANPGDDPGDIFREILKAGHLSDKEVSAEIENDPAFDAVYEVWDWFTR